MGIGQQLKSWRKKGLLPPPLFLYNYHTNKPGLQLVHCRVRRVSFHCTTTKIIVCILTVPISADSGRRFPAVASAIHLESLWSSETEIRMTELNHFHLLCIRMCVFLEYVWVSEWASERESIISSNSRGLKVSRKRCILKWVLKEGRVVAFWTCWRRQLKTLGGSQRERA